MPGQFQAFLLGEPGVAAGGSAYIIVGSAAFGAPLPLLLLPLLLLPLLLLSLLLLRSLLLRLLLRRGPATAWAQQQPECCPVCVPAALSAVTTVAQMAGLASWVWQVRDRDTLPSARVE